MAATPYLHDLTRQIGWPLAIVTPRADQMLLRNSSDAVTSQRLMSRKIGSAVPMLGVSSGLLYLALAPEAERHILLAMMERRQPGSVGAIGTAQRHAFIDRLRLIRLEGHAFHAEDGRRESSFSVPIFAEGRLAAVLALIYMTRSLSPADILVKYRRALVRLGETIVADVLEAR